MKQTSILRLWFLMVSIIAAIFVASSLRSYALPVPYEEQPTFMFGEPDPYTEESTGEEGETDPTEEESGGEEEETDPTEEESDVEGEATESTDNNGLLETEPTDETIPTTGEEPEPTESTEPVDDTVVPLLSSINLSLLLIVEIIKIAIACVFIWFLILKPLRHFVF